MVRGVLLVYPAEIDRKEAARLLRQSYAEAPRDLEMVGLYVTLALRMGLPEAFGILDRMLATDPTHTIVPLENAILRAPDDDPARAERYAARWVEILPEGRAAAPVLEALARVGKLDEARRGLELGKRLGLSAVGEPIAYEGGAMNIELSALEAARAREIAQALLADPRPYARTQGIEGLVTAHFLDGHAGEAFAALASGTKLGADSGYVLGTAQLLVRALAAGRWLGRSAADPAQVEWLGRTAAAQDQLQRFLRASALVELALLAAGPEAARRREAALEAIEAEAAGAGEDRLLRDDLRIQTVPLVRALRGDRAAAAVFRDAERARPVARLRSSVDAGLAFEAIGDAAAAERVYAALTDTPLVRESGLERVIATVRLQKLRKEAGRERDARLWARLAASADPGLIDAIQKMK
jgi:hypothetical protein